MVTPSPRPAAQAGATDSEWALWRLGFRPFYLLASLYAALSVPLWVLQYSGVLDLTSLPGALGHAHGMLFGFVQAVIAGFLFTAVRNWTGLPTPTGAPLAAIAALWLAGRILDYTPYTWLAALANTAFPLVVAAGIGVPLLRARNTRNYFFPVLLSGLALATLAVHLSSLGALALPAQAGIGVGLDLVLLVMAVMAGRVVPMFTNNGVPGARATRHPAVERLALGSVLAILAADLLQAPGHLLLVLLATGTAAHAARLALWQPWRTLRTPIVWVLHVAYAWIVVHLALRALAILALAPAPLATHALTIGAIGGLTIGMMTRTARGHTGRPLVADRWEVACYALITVAALVRVGGPLVTPTAYVASVAVSACAWSAAWGLYFLRYWPILTRARIDGAPG